MSTAAQHAGLVGFVTDGYVRDSKELAATGFPVFARGIYIRRARKANRGVHQVDVQFDDVVVSPGDIVLCDADGAVAVREQEVQAVIARASQILNREQEIRQALAKGQTTLDALGLGHE
jgi:4-hydroxy-4-methyl-2-oxoglutarate aldolase